VLIRRRIKDICKDHCQVGFDPSGLQRDVTVMPSRNGYTRRCTSVLRSLMWLAPKCGNVHSGTKRSIAHLLYGHPRR